MVVGFHVTGGGAMSPLPVTGGIGTPRLDRLRFRLFLDVRNEPIPDGSSGVPVIYSYTLTEQLGRFRPNDDREVANVVGALKF